MPHLKFWESSWKHPSSAETQVQVPKDFRVSQVDETKRNRLTCWWPAMWDDWCEREFSRSITRGSGLVCNRHLGIVVLFPIRDGCVSVHYRGVHFDILHMQARTTSSRAKTPLTDVHEGLLIVISYPFATPNCIPSDKPHSTGTRWSTWYELTLPQGYFPARFGNSKCSQEVTLSKLFPVVILSSCENSSLTALLLTLKLKLVFGPRHWKVTSVSSLVQWTLLRS